MLLLILVSYPTDIFKKEKVIILNDLHILTLIDSLVETDRTLLIFKLKEIVSPCDRYLESNPMLSWTQSVQQKSQAARPFSATQNPDLINNARGIIWAGKDL